MRQSSPREQFQPWQFFVLAALAAATAAVLVSRGSSATNLVFISAAVLTTAVVGIAVYRTLLPLVAPDSVDEAVMVGGRTRAAIEREKLLVLRSIKDLEFDRAMGKMSEEDFREMTGRLRARAARLIKALDAEGSGYQALIERELSARLAQAPSTNSGQARSTGSGQAHSTLREPQGRPEPDQGTTGSGQVAVAPLPAAVKTTTAPTCVKCGTENDVDARFCKRCGGRLGATA